MKSPLLIKYLKLIYFLVIIFVIIPYGWIDSGGSSNNTIAYIFIVMICITFFFHKRLRKLLIIMLISSFTILFSLEYYYPEIMRVHSSNQQFYDRLVQIPLTLLGGYLLLKQFADAYNEEKEKLNEYSEELKKLNKQLELIANTDGLTGLYNRRIFDSRLKEIILEKRYIYEEIHIILFDIDNFKGINDTYGHSTGDEVIYKLGKITQAIMPQTSIISRWGGDEFAIIFFGNAVEVKSHILKLHKKAREIQIEGNRVITVSIGITQILEKDNTKDVFKRVDLALYESKNRGKDMYVFL